MIPRITRKTKTNTIIKGTTMMATFEAVVTGMVASVLSIVILDQKLKISLFSRNPIYQSFNLKLQEDNTKLIDIKLYY